MPCNSQIVDVDVSGYVAVPVSHVEENQRENDNSYVEVWHAAETSAGGEGHWQKQATKGINPMIQKLPQGRAGAGTTSLLAIQTVQDLVEELAQTYKCQEPS